MKVSLQIANFTWPGGDSDIASHLRAIGNAADAAGFDTAWVMDHFRLFTMQSVVGVRIWWGSPGVWGDA